MKISRRTALKKIAGTSLFAATAPLFPAIIGCCKQERAIRLNVVLHGLFILNFTNTEIEMFTPFMEEHIYRAGNWDFPSLAHLRPLKTYRLLGVEELRVPPQLDLDFNILFPRCGFKHFVHREQSVFLVRLPFPETIRLLRNVDDGANYEDPDSNTIVVNRLSLCQVLSYRVPDYRKLELSGTKEEERWKPYIDSESNTANLHFWAEPLLRQPRQHACHAYERLSDMLSPLILKLGTDKTAPLDSDTGIHGLPREQEQGLSEWESGGEGSYPTNCSIAMVHSGTS
jgi:hypothetical protein